MTSVGSLNWSFSIILNIKFISENRDQSFPLSRFREHSSFELYMNRKKKKKKKRVVLCFVDPIIFSVDRLHLATSAERVTNRRRRKKEQQETDQQTIFHFNDSILHVPSLTWVKFDTDIAPLPTTYWSNKLAMLFLIIVGPSSLISSWTCCTPESLKRSPFLNADAILYTRIDPDAGK